MSTEPVRPRWRGRLHQGAFFAWLPLGASLVALAEGAAARAGAAIYAVCVGTMYAASAAFHRVSWGPRARAWMRRLDHSAIYLAIAGTYTPFSLLVLEGVWSAVVLAGVWTGAAFGIALKLSTGRLAWLGATLYMVLGWAAVVTLPLVWGRLGVARVGLLIAGGLLYTAGAIVLLRRKPDPNPAVFGYHEIWHVMVIAASLCHYALILLLVR